MNDQIRSLGFPLLKSLEDLGALSSQYGLFKVKPFKDWISSPLRDTIFTMRLCNAGQHLDMFRTTKESNDDAKIQQLKFRTLSLAIYSINDQPVITQEQLKTYNETHKSNIESDREFVELWLHNLEAVVFERLDAVYGGLEVKQLRLLQDLFLCGSCEKIFKKGEIPEGSKHLNYALTEIICRDCLDAGIDTSGFDFIEDEVKKVIPAVEEKKDIADVPSHKCLCGKEFESIEELTQHQSECAEFQS